MKIQCDVCEKALATVICCADEAALCAKCDVEVHAANKLASKHQRLHLQNNSNKLPPCDICQERTSFIFCVEDRALFCKDCDEAIHSANSRAANHQRFLATGIRVALGSGCNKEEFKSYAEPRPPKLNSQQNVLKSPPQHVPALSPQSWAVDDLLQFSDYESPNKKEQLEFNELEWLTDINFYGGHVCPDGLAAEVPQLPQLRGSQSSNMASYKPNKYYTAHKKARLEIPDDDEEFFTVPDLG